jgi:hypothetical protein
MNDAMMQNILDDLTKNGVDPEKLCVLTCATEQYFGELVEYVDDGVAPVRVKLKDPRRILRLQKVEPGNLRIDILLLDIDLVSSGVITFWPVVFYKLSDVCEDSRLRMMALYARYFKEQEQKRAAAAGIILPEPQTPPGIGQRV